MSMRVRYLLVFAVSFGTTFFLPHIFTELFLQFLFAGVMTGMTWLVQPAEEANIKEK